MMTSAGLVRASVLLTAQTCIAANLPGAEDSRLGGPCCGSGHTDGEEKLTPGWYRTSAYYLYQGPTGNC
jgi:hypothetical protein